MHGNYEAIYDIEANTEKANQDIFSELTLCSQYAYSMLSFGSCFKTRISLLECMNTKTRGLMEPPMSTI